MKYLSLIVFLFLILTGCGSKTNTSQSPVVQDSVFAGEGSFAYDLAFLQKHKNVIELGEASSQAKVLIVNDYQARVMTSTARGDQGNSFGWINYKLIESGKQQPNFNPVGGEDRFWIGPEGGQFSVFFKKGSPFKFENWQTPSLIDKDTFELVSVSSTQASFKKTGSLTNYHGFTFHFMIQRQIDLLSTATIEHMFGISTKNVSVVGYQSTNALTNTGDEDWNKRNGMLSIWILGMFTPSGKTTIVIPYDGSAAANEKKITTDYFGVIPADRISLSKDVLMLKGDGNHRSKVGLSPQISRNIEGSYNAGKHILTLVKFDVEPGADYVNSRWEIQKEPFQGDVVNAYNDGPLTDASQLGPFYELESSSPAKPLKPRSSVVHRHITLHVEGDEHLLNAIAKQTLGVSLAEINNAFNKTVGN